MFRVRWLRKALEQLAEIWNAAPDQAAVTAASYRIDHSLQRDPENQGESRSKNRRIVFDAPLVVVYRIEKANNTVTVIGVKRYGGAKP